MENPRGWQLMPCSIALKHRFFLGDKGVIGALEIAGLHADRLRLRLIEMWRAGGNTVRFWAGGTYPSERLLRTCDSLGLMVWQEIGRASCRERVLRLV